MPSDTSERKPARPQAEALPYPRCNSTNTKFYCYNNYNLSQPRHFCKSRCRYWTQGDALHNVPINGGSRKSVAAASASASSKRPHSLAPPLSSSPSCNSSNSSMTHDPRCRTRVSPACPMR
ncbi:hypothetical protein NL676_030061 [Syzygium grande]|nr:hypothetical protein NL676_030061 [Syzygium grande]